MSLVVYDEAHKAVAQETRNVIEHFMRRTGEMKDCTLMGLSATPGRTTEMSFENDLLASTFGNKIISIDTKVMNEVNLSRQEALNAEVEKDIIRYFQNRGVLAKIKKKELTYAEKLTDEELSKIKVIATKNGYSDFSPAALNVIGKNKSRNLRIMQELRALNQSQTPTIVFACSVKHGQLLSSMLTLEDIPNALVIGEMSATERREAIRKFKDTKNDMNILINYEVLTTGFDATNIECVFIHYYGIYDDTDYSGLHVVRGKYDEKELNETYIGNVRRYDLIYKYYCKYGSKQALGFCYSKAHAEDMAGEFCKRGIPSVAVYSGEGGAYSEDRSGAIEKLKNGNIRVIFSVDMFNEGVEVIERNNKKCRIYAA